VSLTTDQVAPLLGITAPGVRKLVQRGILEPIRRGTRPLHFDEQVVADLQQARWRAQQRAAGSQLDDTWAEIDDLVAAQVRAVSRCGHAEPSRNQVEGPAFPAE